MWTELASLTLNLVREQNSNLGDEDVSSCVKNISLKLWTLYSSDSFVSFESIYMPVSALLSTIRSYCIPVRAGEDQMNDRLIKYCQSYFLLSFTEFSATRIIHSEEGHNTVNDLADIKKR